MVRKKIGKCISTQKTLTVSKKLSRKTFKTENGLSKYSQTYGTEEVLGMDATMYMASVEAQVWVSCPFTDRNRTVILALRALRLIFLRTSLFFRLSVMFVRLSVNLWSRITPRFKRCCDFS